MRESLLTANKRLDQNDMEAITMVPEHDSLVFSVLCVTISWYRGLYGFFWLYLQLAHFLYALTSSHIYWPIFKLISLTKSGEYLQ